MPHIDEGRLHAWLDRKRSGLSAEEAAEIETHLAMCGACRAEADAAERLRERAATILAGAGPARVEPPAFETLSARSGAIRRRSPNRSLVAVAWAASVMLALGLGWLSRDLFRPDQIALESPARSGADAPPRAELEAPASAPAGSGTVVGSDPGEVAIGSGRQDVPLPPPAAAAGSGAAAAPSAEAVTESVANGTPRAEAARGEDRARAAGLEPPASPEPPVIPAEAGIQVSPSAADDNGRPVSVAASRSAFSPESRAATGAARSDESVPIAAAASATPPAPPGPVSAALMLTPPADALAWFPVDRALAERRLGRALVTLDGPPIARVEVRESDGDLTVRVVHVLPDGGELILAQRLGAEVEPDRSLIAAGFTTVGEQRGDLRLTLWGRLDQATLRLLLRQAR